MTTLEKSKYELSTNCECRVCETCSMGTESAICDECQGETTPTDWCDGACWEYKRDWFEEDVERFLSHHNNPSQVTIAGKHIGWQRLHGYKTISADHKSIFNALTFSGDWTLGVECDGKNFIITRYSHDEPTGATFWLLPTTEEDENNE